MIYILNWPKTATSSTRFSSNPNFIAEELPVGKTPEGQIVAVNTENEQGAGSHAASVVVT